ncbi:hypothetical protein ACFQ3N_19510 [Virgibacillus byunsanensis]|uniref:Uncharacterized protein n=1 Tax=Virgibacillus byunsanensis TaxID=570945 RepID=A0ABW3LQ69_9BACI
MQKNKVIVLLIVIVTTAALIFSWVWLQDLMIDHDIDKNTGDMQFH